MEGTDAAPASFTEQTGAALTPRATGVPAGTGTHKQEVGEESGGGTDGVDEDVVAPAEAFDTFSPTNLCKYTGWDIQAGERVSESQNGYQSTSYLKGP